MMILDAIFHNIMWVIVTISSRLYMIIRILDLLGKVSLKSTTALLDIYISGYCAIFKLHSTE